MDVESSMRLEGLATTNQGDCRFGPYAGSQCLSICVVYLASSYYNNSIPITDTSDLDEIISLGTRLDATLRNKNLLPKNKFAQLSHIPSVLKTHRWTCRIETSMELHGQVDMESSVKAPFVLSLTRLLKRNYYDITQYILYICNGKSGGIIIKGKRYYIFDPHCTGNKHGTPAAVFSTTKASDITKYVGDYKSEYTACHIYFIPSEYSDEPIMQFLLSNYGIQLYERREGPKIDIETMDTMVLNCDRPSQSDIQFGSMATTTPKTFIDASTAFQHNLQHIPKKTLPGSTFLINDMKDVGRKRSATVQKSNSISDIDLKPVPNNENRDDEGSDSSGGNVPRKMSKPSSEYSSIETFWMEDNIDEMELVETEDEEMVSSDPLFTIDGGTGDENTQNGTSSTSTSTDNSPVQGIAQTLPESVADFYRLDFSDNQTIQINFAQLESQIQNLEIYPHMQSLPNITETNMGRTYRESIALKFIDHVISNIIIEQGLVSNSEHVSNALNVLRFVILWAQKLKIPTEDLQVLLKTKLEIPKIYEAIKNGEFTQPIFKEHLQSKVDACLKKMYSNKVDIESIFSIIENAIKRAEYSENSIDAKDHTKNILYKIDEDPYIICSSDDVDKLSNLIYRLYKTIVARNAEIKQEDTYFTKALAAIQSFLPIPTPSKPLEYDISGKTKQLKKVLGDIISNLTKDIESIGENFVETINNPDIISLDIQDFHSVLNNINITLENIKLCTDNLRIQIKEVSEELQQIVYMGGEISGITNSKWPFETPQSVSPMSIFERIKETMQHVNTQTKNKEALETILSEIDDMITSMKSDSSQLGSIKTALSLPVIESYLANAGVLVGKDGNSKFETLKKELKELSTSENIVIAMINNVSLETMMDDARKLSVVLSGNGLSKATPTIDSAIQNKLTDLFDDVLSNIRASKIDKLDLHNIVSLETLASLSSDKTQVISATFYVRMVQILHRIMVNNNINKVMDDLKAMKTELAISDIKSVAKRKIYKALACMYKDCKKKLNRSQKSTSHKGHKPREENSDANIDIKMDVQDEGTDQMPSTDESHTEMETDDAPQTKPETDKAPSNDITNIINDIDMNNVEDVIKEEVRKAAEEAWEIIESSTKTLTFDNISGSHWERLSQYMDLDAKFSGVVGQRLEKITRDLLEMIKDICLNKIVSISPYGTPFGEISLEWIYKYRDNVIFYLMTSTFPKIAEIATNTSKEIKVLLQACTANDILQATAGTYLYSDTQRMFDIITSIEEAASDYKSDVTSKVNDFLDRIKSDPTLAKLPPRPQIITPKSLLDPKLNLIKESLNKKFRECVENAQEVLLVDIINDFQLFRQQVADAEEAFNQNLAEINHDIAEIIYRSKENIPSFIYMKDIPKEDPLSLFTDILKDKELMNKKPYAETLEVLDWCEATCQSILLLCHTSFKSRVEKIFNEITNIKKGIREASELEKKAAESEDIAFLKNAINSLDPKRVTGGQTTVNGWINKVSELEMMLMKTELESKTRYNFQSLTHIALCTQTVHHLSILKEKVTQLKSTWDASKYTDVDLTNKLEELTNYIIFKSTVIQFFTTHQMTVFQNYPLPQTSSENMYPVYSMDLEKRLSALLMNRAEATSTLWLEVAPNIDNLVSDYIPLTKNSPPLSFHIVFHNIFETHLTPSNNILHKIQTPTDKGSLPGTHRSRLGVSLNYLLSQNIKDLTAHSVDVINAYISTKLVDILDRNEFISMTLTLQASIMCIQSIDNKHMATGKINIFIDFKQFTKIILQAWPEVVHYFLHSNSFEEGFTFLKEVYKIIITSLPNMILLQYPDMDHTAVKILNQSFSPSAFLFAPKFWNYVDIQEELWGNAAFKLICQNSLQKARVCFLIWALLCLDPLVIEQLWNSLTPSYVEAKLPQEFLRLLWRMAYKWDMHSISHSSKKQEQPFYTYGTPKDSIIQIHKSEMVSSDTDVNVTHRGSVPISAFEIALGAILMRLPLNIYISSEGSALINGTDAIGPLFLISPLLDCTGDVEPFKGLLEVPLKLAEPNHMASQYTKLEEQIFSSQALWLQNLARGLGQEIYTGNNRTHPLLVLIDREGALVSVHQPVNSIADNHTLPRESANVQFVFHTNHNEWPMEIMASSFLLEQPDTSQLKRFTKMYTTIKSQLQLETFFSTFPNEIHKKRKESDNVNTEAVPYLPAKHHAIADSIPDTDNWQERQAVERGKQISTEPSRYKHDHVHNKFEIRKTEVSPLPTASSMHPHFTNFYEIENQLPKKYIQEPLKNVKKSTQSKDQFTAIQKKKYIIVQEPINPPPIGPLQSYSENKDAQLHMLPQANNHSKDPIWSYPKVLTDPMGFPTAPKASIKHNYLTIGEIISNQLLLTTPRSTFVPIPEALEPISAFHLLLKETSINEAKRVLLNFIDQIKHKLLDSANFLVQSINKIKSLYL